MVRILLVSLFFTFLFIKITAKNFTNPISEHAPDPWMVYYNGNYHLIATTGRNFFGIRKASSLEGLKSVDNTKVYSINGDQGWAPEIHHINGKWYLYYAACEGNTGIGCHRNHVAESVSEDPMGPYIHKADLVDSTDADQMQLDPSIIKINGKLYLIASVVTPGSQNLYIIELINPYTITGHKTVIAIPTYDWEKQGGTINEGPEPLYNGNRTFIIYSACSCATADYKLGLLEFIGTDPLNADHWKKYPTPVFQRNDANKVYGPGHNGFFKSPDGTEDWIVYHAQSNPQGGCDDNRSSRAQKFTFNSNGLPNFGEPIAAGVPLTVPSGEI